MDEGQLTGVSHASKLVSDATVHVKELFKKELPSYFHFHNFNHTLEVMAVCRDISETVELSDQEHEAIQLAALFHLSGYTKKYDEYINESQQIAESFIQEKYSDDAFASLVKELIAATHPDHIPQNLKEEILHDAIYAFTGKKTFFRQAELLRLEQEQLSSKTYTEEEWQKYVLNYLANIYFLTEAAKSKFEKRKQKNIRDQRNNILKAKKITTRENSGKDIGRGVDTLYRANYRNHINLSAIADGKANMMISINTIVLSVILTLSGASLSLSEEFIVENMRFVLPILFLLIGALLSVIFAVLSAKPAVTSKTNSGKDVKQKKTSLLYFGNFLSIPVDEFVDHLNELKQNQQKLYDSMSIDLYNLGKVLNRKYKLLSVSYNIFMVALTISVVSFIFIFLFTNF